MNNLKNRDFSDVKRVVIKLGTKILSDSNGIDIDVNFIRTIAKDIASLTKKGYRVLLVSSGAIGFGAGLLKLKDKPVDIALKQACAAIGQPLLMNYYKEALEPYNLLVGQVLVERSNFNNRESFLNLKNSVESLLNYGVIPIFNENDLVSTGEIKPIFGDNDNLSAHVASKLNAELLLILSDIDALYDKNPSEYDDAKPISLVKELTAEIKTGAGSAGSKWSTGGMETKLQAVEIASSAGCRVVIAHGRENNIIERILDGEELGTLFLPGKKLKDRLRWIKNSDPVAVIKIDKGAQQALLNRKSLLPKGITGVEGVFEKGDVVNINQRFKGITRFNSDDVKRIAGKESADAMTLFKESHRPEVVHADDIVETEEF